MACNICQGGGDQYACDNEDCPLCGPIACEYCADVYDYKCPECGERLHDTRED